MNNKMKTLNQQIHVVTESEQMKSLTKIISDEEIYELREQGLSYRAIANHFKEQGIEVSYQKIKRRCKKIYKLKGKKEPKVKSGPKQKIITISDEEIYELREQGLSYKSITNHFKDKGIEISTATIVRRCKKIYELREKEEAETKRRTKQKIIISDEEIYELREQRLSYRAIANHFKEQGIEVSHQTIRNRCKEIYELKGEEEHKTKRGTKQKIIISDEEIYELREQRLSYMAIANHFKEQGIEVSYQTIKRRCKKIYKLKGKKEPKAQTKTKTINHERKSELNSLEEKLQNEIEKKKETKRLLEDYKKLEERLQQEKNGEEKDYE